jgi:hypothetical protein
MKLAFTLLIFLFISFVNNVNSLAQNIEPFIAQSNASGEETIATLEVIAIESKNRGERLFVIARLGTGETRRAAKTRLFNTQQKLSSLGFNSQNTVFAEGERVKGEGRIEFYLGSHLHLVILAKRNKMPNLTCCEDYFPPAKRKTQKRKS